MKYAVHLFKSSEPGKFLSLAQPKLQDPRFPSWAPDWTVKNKRSNLAEAFIPQEKRLYKTATSSPFKMQLDDTGRMLVSRGAIFHSIAFIGNDFWSKPVDDNYETNVLLMFMDTRMFCVHMTRYANGEALVEALWRTLTLGRPSDGDRGGAAYAASYTAARKIFESIPDFTRPHLLPHFRSASIAFIAMCDALRG